MFKVESNNIVTNNEELSEIHRLIYLYSALKNEVKRLETAEETFDSSFKVLKNRFENQRIILNVHLKAALEFERIIQESSKELRPLVDVMKENIRALQLRI